MFTSQSCTRELINGNETNSRRIVGISNTYTRSREEAVNMIFDMRSIVRLWLALLLDILRKPLKTLEKTLPGCRATGWR